MLVTTAATATTATATTATATTTSTTLVATAARLLAAFLVLTLLLASAEGGGCETLGEIDLGADGVGEVADHEDVLNVVVEVMLDLLGIDLGGQGEGGHEMLGESVVGDLILIEDTVDPLAHFVEHADGLLDGLAETLDIGDERSCPALVVLCAGDGLKSASLGVAVQHLMRDLHEEAALGGALSVDRNRGADVASRLDLVTRLGRDGKVNSRVRESACVRAAEEVLDEGAEAVELVGGGVPAEKGLAGRGLEGKGEHVLLVLDIDLDLILLLGVRDGEALADLDFCAIFGSGAHKGADDSGGLGAITDIATCGVIEDGENGL